MTTPELSIVIPLYNEASHLNESLVTIRSEIDALVKSSEYVLVDDGSTDDTWKTICRFRDSCPHVQAVRLSRNFGKEAALCAGLERASGSAVLVMDGDLQHDPSRINEMYTAWKNDGYDVVEAVKVDRGEESAGRRLQAMFFYTLFKKLSGFDLHGASDFKLLDKKVMQAWVAMPEKNIFFRGMSAWAGFRRKRIPVAIDRRVEGDSRWSVGRLFGLALRSITAFSSLPLHLVTVIGGCFLLSAVVLGLLALYYKATGIAVSGFTTVILLQLIIGSMLMIALGIIGEYLARIYEEVKGRPRYIVSESIGAEDEASYRL